MEILHRRRVAALVAAMVALVAVSVSGQSSTNSCANILVPCLPYLSSDKPPSSCCDPLKKTVQDDLPCLCALFNNTEIFKAYNINITQALLLPLHCGINNVSACNDSSPGASYTPPANPGGNGKNAAYRASWIGIPGPGGKLLLSGFTVSWLDDKDTFQAGDRGTIKVKPFDNSFNDKNFSYSSYGVNFSLSVSGKKGNSSYISGVFPYFEGDPTSWNISFTPIRVGEFIVVITEDHSGITDLSLHFTVTPGHMYASACMVSWMNLVNVFVAGTKAYFLVLPKDAFGNNISSNISKDYFKVAASYENGSFINMLDVRDTGWNEFGYIGIEFLPITAGSFLLHVYADNQTLSGSPLAFMVKPGSLDITSSVAKWKYETNSLQIFSKLEIFIYQQDQFGNLIPGFYPFDARIVEKATSLTVPVADLFFQEVAQGIQLLSFIVPEPGEFMLTIFSTKNNESISSMPYHYTVFIGYCHGVNSVVNGSGLGHSIAGRMSYFTVYLKDLYLNPALVETIRLRVHILGKDADFGVLPIIFPLRGFNETEPASGQINFANGSFSPFPALSVTENITLTGKSAVVASDFNISYTPEKSGVYEIWVFCGNIPLNDGHSYRMEVVPGTVDTSLSSVLNFVPSVQRLIKNEVLVQLLDALFNPITSHKSRLSFQIEPANSSSFLTWAFEDNGNGSYVGSYLAKDLGSYKLCILVEDQHLSPCPFEVHVYEREYFPVAYNDNISVWEDESVAFNVLSNDYILGGPASIEVSMPLHGSLLQSGRLFIYTPYKGYFGMDTFAYTISDVNKNSAVGTVFISVLCKPPQFVSLPLQLHVTEDIVSPKFGGFSGFEILYSDVTENISVTIRAQFGIVLFAPMPMQLYQPFESTLSVSRGGRAGKDLILSGHVEAINSALKFIQYIGNDNFYGHDILNLYAANKNGIQDAQVPMLVEPINDAPIIHSPKFIVLGMQEGSEQLQIFDKQRDIFEFSILDPDIFNFPGSKLHFLVTFSMEVNDGTLSISLPVNLINSAELKTSSSNQWQPLQTFVTISSHFLLKGKGVRFRGTIGDCNNAMQRIFYQGPSHGAILSITVNDMGNYGCYPDCPDMMSLPQLTEATVSIVRKRPVSSVTSLLLGSAIIIEIVMMLILNGLLLFFICKCMNALHREKRDSVSIVNLHREESLRNQKMNASELSRNVAYIDGHSRHFSLGRQQYKFHHRSCGRSGNKLTIKNGLPSSQSSGDNHQPIPLSVEMKTEEIH